MYRLLSAIIWRFQIVEDFFGFRARQLVQNLTPFGVPLGLVRQQVPDVNPPVRTDHVVGDLIAFEQVDQELARDAEHPGRFDRGQLGVILNDRHRLALRTGWQ